jgi:putative DNA methylase
MKKKLIEVSVMGARIVKCPNPQCGAQMPMVRTFELSSKPGKQAWVEPVVDHGTRTVKFRLKTDCAPEHQPSRQRGRATCLICGNSSNDSSLRETASKNGIGSVMMAVVAEGPRGRVYLDATSAPECEKANR